MGQSIEVAIVFTLTCLLCFSLISYGFSFLITINREAVHLAEVNHQQVDDAKIYELAHVQKLSCRKTGGKIKEENIPYISTSPLKIVKTIQLVQDIFHLDELARIRLEDSWKLPQINPAEGLPRLPYPDNSADPLPQLPVPDSPLPAWPIFSGG